MGEFLQNMYVWLWAALAILMIIVGIKYRHEHQGLLAVLMAVFFIFMTVWYGLRTFAGYPMFEGTLNIIFRCILGGFLVALGLIYWFIRKRKYYICIKNKSDSRFYFCCPLFLCLYFFVRVDSLQCLKTNYARA